MKSWPKLQYHEWKETYQTLHRYLQIVGKLRIYKAPWINHSWHATFYVNSRGLTSSAIPLGDRNLTVQFDFIHHQVIFEDSLGKSHIIPLENLTVSHFFSKFMNALRVLEITGYENDYPVECTDNIRFSEDETRKTYNPEQANNFFQILVRVTNVFQKYRAEFSGKSSPVHFFWGSFDLAVTRFSGNQAPEHPGIAPYVSQIVMKEAYSHEVSSCGFWPGNDQYPHALFYSYAYPTPDGYSMAAVKPEKAFYNQELGEFVLHYDDLQESNDPDGLLLDFLHSTFQVALKLGHWDEKKLGESSYWRDLSEKYQPSYQ